MSTFSKGMDHPGMFGKEGNGTEQERNVFPFYFIHVVVGCEKGIKGGDKEGKTSGAENGEGEERGEGP